LNRFNESLVLTFKLLKEDKFALLLSMIPIIIGIVLFSFLGRWAYTDLFDYLKSVATPYFQSESLGFILSYIIAILIAVILYFLISFGFVVIVTLISSPFNDLLSERVQKKYFLNIPLLKPEKKNTLLGFIRFFFNEIKKLVLIIFLSIFAFILSFFPILFPFGVVLSGILFAINFLDYSWSRHDFTLRNCLVDFYQSGFLYILTGVVAIVFMAIPVINLLVYPLLNIVFTTQFYLHKKGKDV
jgi:CysZ protein